MNTSSSITSADGLPAIRPRRKIVGMSAILLPFLDNGDIDWNGFQQHIRRTLDAGLIPAVNMDTGYANLIDDQTRATAIAFTQELVGDGRYVAGVWVKDSPGASFDVGAYLNQMEAIQGKGGIPILFQSYGLAHGTDEAIVAHYTELATHCDQFLAFELGEMFAPFGRIYSSSVYEELIKLPSCIGAKHSSLDRELEWRRLQLRDQHRKEFLVLTGNDLAIDMVMYGSDYLLGLSTFCPDVFARRDALWAAGDRKFYALNDRLQYLGFLAFRPPVPAYKHSAAMFLKLRGWIQTNRTHPASPTRPDSDLPILQEIARQLALTETDAR